MTDTDRPDASAYRSLFESYAFELDPALSIDSPVLTAALGVWEAARGDRLMPARDDIDVLAIPREILPHIVMLNIEAGPPERFRWRLLGTHVTSTLGRDSTGAYFDELYRPNEAETLLRSTRWVMEHKRPLRTLGDAFYIGKTHLRSENLEMPLSDDGETVSMMFIASVFRLGED